MPTTERNRFYSAPPSVKNVGNMYGWSDLAVNTGSSPYLTGNWVALTTDASGNLNVNLGGSSSTGGITIQGGNTIPVVVTGGVTVVGLVASGTFTSSNPVGVTGTRNDLAATYSTNLLAPYPFLPIGGRVVNPTGFGSVTGDYATGSYAMLNFAPNGSPYVNQGALDSGFDSVLAAVVGGNRLPVNISGIVLTQVTGNVNFDSTSIVNAQASGNASAAGILIAQQSGDNYLAYISGKLDRLGLTGGSIQTVVTGSSFDSTSIVLAQASGNALLTTANQLASGVSGLLSSNLSSAAWVTGQVTMVGSSTSTNSGPSGVAPWTSMTSFVSGLALAANANRLQFGIQNIHTGIPLYVNFGALVSTGVFSFILGPGTSNAGQTFVNDRYKGQVQASGGGWTVWEI